MAKKYRVKNKRTGQEWEWEGELKPTSYPASKFQVTEIAPAPAPLEAKKSQKNADAATDKEAE